MASRCAKSVAFLVCTAFGAATALGDSISHSNTASGTYHYNADADDNQWDPGDVITLAGMDLVTGASEPNKWSVTYTQYTVTWTCLQETHGKMSLQVYSLAPEGDVSWSVQSTHPDAGSVVGPAYVPEAGTCLMFGAGLAILGGIVWRRRRPSEAIE